MTETPYSELTIEEIQKKLQQPTPPEFISWKPQSLYKSRTGDTYTALALAHHDARFVQKRLDEVVGAFNWKVDAKILGGLIVVGIAIRHPKTSEWIEKWDTGHDDPDAMGGYGGGRGVFSQGLKRAGVEWGIGRDLYDFPNPRCKCEVYTDGGGKARFKKWAEDPWVKSESGETGRSHSSIADDPKIVADWNTFYAIAYSRLKLDRNQANQILKPFLDEKAEKYDWHMAILKLEEQLPPDDRHYTKQVNKKHASGDPGS